MIKNLLLFFFLLGSYLVVDGQNFSNKGKDFWVGYGYHQVMINSNTQDMVLYFATDQITTVTVSIPGLAYTQTYTNIPANTIFTTPILPKTGSSDSRLFLEGVSNKGIHVVSTKPIVAYAHIYNSSVSGACVLLPSSTLGKEYYSINYTNNSNNINANSWFYVVAADTGTTNIEITPSANTIGGWIAGNTYTVTLTQGQIYNVMGSLLVNTVCGGNTQGPCTAVDLTGSKIKSIASGSSGCKKIAVYSGSGRISLTCNNTPSSSDNYMVQAFPKSAWGKKYLTASTGGNMTRNIYRVCVSDPATIVKINGVITALPLVNNFYYEIPVTNVPQKIEGNLPITVAQYITSQNACGNGSPGDPEVIYLSPVEQSISNVLFNSNLLVATNPSHFVNVVLPNGGTAISSFKRDGVTVPPASFTVHPQEPAYSFIKIAGLTLGQHTLVSDSGFNAIAYGFASAESYGYNAGTNVRDFNQNLEIQSLYGVINEPSSCSNSPFSFRIYLPDSVLSNSGPTSGTNQPVRFDSMRWDVTNASAFSPNNFPVKKIGNTLFPPLTGLKLLPDSLTLRNGKSVAWYSIPNQYAISTPGIYTITITGYRTSNNEDGCNTGNETEYEFNLTVVNPPVPTFTNNQPGCPLEPIQFTETTPQGPTPNFFPTYRFWWSFFDPINNTTVISTVRNPVHNFTTPGVKTVRFSNITTPGCLSDTTTQPITIPALVNATISGTTVVCQNTPPLNIGFTITDGLPPYKINYTLSTNGGAAVAQTPIITSSLSNTISVSTGTVGTYAYNITSIENANAAFCVRPITGQTATVTVNPLPTATISGTTTVCQGTNAPLITFTGANAAAPYTFTYNVNGGTNQTVTTTTGNSVTVAAPTTTTGTYTYTLLSVQDASASVCTNTASGSAIITVQATSTATIADNASVCQDATAPTITFTAANGDAPFTFEYNINGGATQTVVTAAPSNSAIVTVPMTATGTFIYNLTSVKNTGPTVCVTPITNQTATVVINPNPTATITGSTIVCQNTGTQNITFTGAGGTAPYTFTYDVNGGSSQTVTTTTGNSVTVPASSATVGTFIYTMTQVQDASVNTQCSRTYTTGNTATVQVQATSTATISGTANVCQDATAPLITFTGSNGVAPFTFEYNINGGATQTISTTAASNSLTVPVSMALTGTFVYNLLSVKNTGPILCLTPITGASSTVIIRPLPMATIAIGGSNTLCQNSTPPNITFIGANATAPYTFTYTINGGAPQTVTTTIGNSVTLAVPTAMAGIYIYDLTQVQEATGCIKNYTNTIATLTVKQLATATLATNAATVCQASTSAPLITFTANGGVAPYTFSYTLNGTPLTVTTTVGNTVTVPVPVTTPGTFTYNLVSVQESSIVACINNQTGTAQVIVHPKPTASFTTTGPFCEFKSVLITPAFGITPTGSVVSWVWDYGDGIGSQIRTNGNPFTLTYPTAGVKIITFKTVSDNGCVSDLFTPTPPVTIFSKPKAGFINPGTCLADAQAQFFDTSTVAGVGASIVFWEWDFGDGSPIFAGTGPTYQNPSHAYAAVGQKTVTLIVTSNSGCKDTVIQQFFINGEVTKAEFTTLNAANLCSNRPVQIRENSVVNVGGLIRTDIYWDYIGAPTVFDQDNAPTPNKIYTHSYPNLQVDRLYKVRYYAYSGFNGVCQKDTLIDILVRASPVAQFLTVPDACLNGGTIVLNQGTASGGTAVYTGPGVTFAGGVYTFNPLATGVVVGTNNSVVYTVTSPAGCDSAKVQQVKVLAPPVVNTFAPVGNICHNNSVTFHQTSTMGDGTIVKWIYNWNDGSPLQVMTSGADVTHVYTTTGSHTATLTLETAYGCRNLPFPVTFTVNPLPVPSYTFSNSVCLPSANVVFTNTTPAVASNTYQWSFELPSTSAANTSILTSPSHIYTSQGPFNTHLIATNITTGCVDSTAVIVINSNTIYPAPVLQFNTIPDVCLNNGIVSFLSLASETSGIAGGPGVFSGTGIVSANGDFNPLTAGVGSHVITYTWTSSFNCPTTITKTVNVLAAPVADFATVGNTCQNSAVTFQQTSTSTVGAIAQWIYDWGDGSPTQTFTNGNDQTHVYTIAPATAFVATLTVITNGGCKSLPKQISVNVNPQPLPNFTFSDTACLPQAKVLFNNTTPNISDWAFSWNFNFPSTLVTDLSTQSQPLSHTYFIQGPHNVKLVATSAFTGCTNTITKAVNTIHPAPVASFNFNKPSVCLAQNVTVLDNSTSADGSPLTWLWNYGETSATSSGQIQAPYTYGTAKTYNVKLSFTNSFGCVDDTVRSFTVYPYPVINAGPDDVVLEGGTFPMAATASGNTLTYLWSSIPSPTYLNSNIILNPLAKPVVDINYKLTVTAEGGCAKSDNVFIKVLKFPEIPNTFTPNNDGIHDFWEIKYLFTYPGNRVQVFTRTGQLVFESKGYAKPWDGNMNGKSLPFDTYYYIIEPGSSRKPITGYVTIIK